MPNQDDDPPDSYPATPPGNTAKKGGLFDWLKGFRKEKSENGNGNHNLREAIEEYIIDETQDTYSDTVSSQERLLISNVLRLREISVVNVMVPRADIVAIEVSCSPEDLMMLLSEKQYSRVLVYRETLDDVLGTIHIKDIVSAVARGEKIDIQNMVSEVPIVSPAMSILDLLLEMQQNRRHMALVVDEYGGIDGLVTIGDVIESIVGEIDDEHDTDEEPEIKPQKDGSLVTDSRMHLEEFEEKFGMLFTPEEHAETDTLGGVVSLLAGRVPVRGEVLPHPSGIVFEVVDADPRRIKTLKIRNIPAAE